VNKGIPPDQNLPIKGEKNHLVNQAIDNPSLATKRVDELIQRIKESTEKLAGDHASRGDLKILSRTLKELRYAFKIFAPYRRMRKVTVFGSARTPADHPAYHQAVIFGQIMSHNGWFVITGASSGIMEAGHVGSGRDHAMGLNILLPFEQSANSIIAGDPKLVHMKYFFTRKLMFVKETDAICLLPGGFGTLDEGLEVLTLLQTGKHDIMPIVLLDEPGGDYWTAFQDFVDKQLLCRGMISPEDLSLYKLADNVDEAVAEILQFYRVYHSLRYVKSNLVIRLQRRPSDVLLENLNTNFTDILVAGRFQVGEALPEEHDDPELNELPRLIFQFDRRNYGRLRQLIDCINRDTAD
jgi:uncharacterized protein (TIGR00730 family)